MKGNDMTYVEWYQTIEKPRLAAITPAEREANAVSHAVAFDGDCYRCTNCEISSWNAWQRSC